MIRGRGAVERPEADDFAGWVEPYVPAMARFAARIVSSGDRDDVVQEALLRAWQRWETYDAERGTPLAWLLGIVTDRARKHQRRWASRRLVFSDEPASVHDPATHSVMDLDLEHALRSLTHRQRMAVELYYFVDLDIDTTAQVMGCAPGTVKATLHQARERLRDLMGGNR